MAERRARDLGRAGVVVEVVLKIDGIGYLLWEATLKQDFGVLLAATWGFAVLSSALMLAQAAVEIGVARWVRRSPPIPEGVA